MVGSPVGGGVSAPEHEGDVLYASGGFFRWDNATLGDEEVATVTPDGEVEDDSRVGAAGEAVVIFGGGIAREGRLAGEAVVLRVVFQVDADDAPEGGASADNGGAAPKDVENVVFPQATDVAGELAGARGSRGDGSKMSNASIGSEGIENDFSLIQADVGGDGVEDVGAVESKVFLGGKMFGGVDVHASSSEDGFDILIHVIFIP